MWLLVGTCWSLVSTESTVCAITDNYSHLLDRGVMNGVLMKELDAGKFTLRDYIVE